MRTPHFLVCMAWGITMYQSSMACEPLHQPPTAVERMCAAPEPHAYALRGQLPKGTTTPCQAVHSSLAGVKLCSFEKR